MAKNILMVLDSYFPVDIRVQKEIDALVEHGHQITVLCYRNHGQEIFEQKGLLSVVRSKRVIAKKMKGMLDVYVALFNTNPVIHQLLQQMSDSTHIFDLVHVHDIPVIPTVFAWNKQNMPIVLDMHENYPDGVDVWFSWRQNSFIKLKNKMLFSYEHWIKREREAVQKSDFIITVVEEMKERIVQTHKIDPDKVVVVRNTEPKNLFPELDAVQNTTFKNLVYVGGIGPHRGLDTAIKAMPKIIQIDAAIQLTIVGSGNTDTINYLKNLALDLKVDKNVEFTGQKPGKVARSYMQNAFLNIIPHHSNGQNESGLPHKLFQIMLSKFPLMVSSCKPLKRIIGDHHAGLVFEAGNPEDFYQKVKWALNNKAQLDDFKNKAYDLAKNQDYNWEYDGAVLARLYQ